MGDLRRLRDIQGNFGRFEENWEILEIWGILEIWIDLCRLGLIGDFGDFGDFKDFRDFWRLKRFWRFGYLGYLGHEHLRKGRENWTTGELNAWDGLLAADKGSNTHPRETD